MFRSSTLTIERLGQRGEGIAVNDNAQVFVPFTVPGDVVEAELDGSQGRLVRVIKPSPERIEAFCTYFTACGGCAVQTLAPAPYAQWKADLVRAALTHQRVEAEVAPLVDAHGEGRRRVTFHARIKRDALERATIEVGFMRARAHDIVDIDVCPILTPALASAPRVARRIAQLLAQTGKPLDILLTTSLEGLDVDIRGVGKLAPALRQQMVELAQTIDLARLSNHGEVIVENRPPRLQMGRALLTPPPGAFLQATEAGETVLSDLVKHAIGKSDRVADLFAGVGTFSLRLAEIARVHAVEGDAAMVNALTRAAHTATGLKAVTAQTRDLFRRPLPPTELKDFDAVVFDPPRAGAEAQAKALAQSDVPIVVAVSCNAQTFARDASLLIAGGYEIGTVTPVDQFRHSAHVEVVAAFRKRAARGAKRKRSLLG
ncbi:MAG TPA: class I SAM-dependent RNA methyltransferase [Beijerinckiaceae bacterium]|jgi:23S rRNA (uracil1939-C5)-methyltransferase|nr:class I SAM-dependent RNA methyltransferase [Beijerinckiaceae bacterium]